MFKKDKGKKKPRINYCVVREDPKERLKKTMPKNLAAKIPAFDPQNPKSMPKRMTQPAEGSTEQRAKNNKEYFKKHRVNLK